MYSTSSHVGSGIPDGAKAGIGVGVPVAIAAVGVMVHILIKTEIFGAAASPSAPA
jgi:hypothetical protein